MKPNPKSVRLFVWMSSDEYTTYTARTAKQARDNARSFGGTYLGEYIARPVVKKPAKKKGARR